MISAYKFSHDQLPPQLKSMTFDQERETIYSQLVKLLNDYELSSAQNWFPVNNLISKFKQIYSFNFEERQEICEILLAKVENVKSIIGIQNVFSLIVTIIQNKQKYLKITVDWRHWHQFLLNRFMNNTDKSITSQTFTTSLFMQFCQFLKTIKQFFTADVVDFAFQKFKENYCDKQLAWAYLILFVPFRKDIPQAKYHQIIQYIMDPIQLEKDNCRLKFILNYLRLYPGAQIEIIPQMMRLFHGIWRLDLHQDDKNEKMVNVFLPDETLGIPSVFKIMPQLLIELIGSSQSDGYAQAMQAFRSMFALFDSITSVHNQQTWDDQIFKLLKLLVGNFTYKYRHDELLLKIMDLKSVQKYDHALYQQMIQDLIIEYDAGIEQFINSGKYIEELLNINPDQTYSSYMKTYSQIGPVSEESFEFPDKKTLLDPKAKQDFLEIIMSVMDKVLYMEDPGYATAKTVLYLCSFEESLIDIFMTKMKAAMQNISSLPFVTIKSILIFLTFPLLQKSNKYGVEDFKEFLVYSFQLFAVQGMTENIDALELYSKIMMNIPVYESDEPIQEFLNEFIIEVFKVVIANLPLIKYKDVDYGFVLPNLINIFWPFICNSSETVVKQILGLILQYIDQNLSMPDLNALGDLLDCIVFRFPHDVLKPIIDICMEKLLKNASSVKEKHFLDFILEASPYKQEILKYEITSCNKNSKILWLTLLEKVLTYAGSATQRYDKELQTLVMLYLQEEEDEIYIKVSDIIHTVVITNQMIKPKSFTARDFPSMKLKEVLDDKYEWELPTRQDWEFIFKWNEYFMFNVKKEFQTNYMHNYQHYKIPDDFEVLLEQMIFTTPPMDPKLKTQCYRMWFLIFGCFTGSSLFAPFQGQDLDMDANKTHLKLASIQQEYLDKICPPEYKNLRYDLGVFVVDSVCFAISKGIAHDKDINDLLVTIGSECVGCQVITQELQSGREFLEGSRQLNMGSQSKMYFSSHIQQLMDTNTYLYQRHMFLMSLQAIPQQYNEIYCYIIVLYLLSHSEFTNPQYLLPYSTQTTKMLASGIREQFFSYLLKILDNSNPTSKLSQINASSDKSKGYKQLQDLLSGFNSAVQHISPDITISIKIQQQLNKFITLIEHVDNNNCKSIITESCVHQLAINYDENNSANCQERLQIIDESANAVASQQFWKCKIIHSLSLFNNLNMSQTVPVGCVETYKQLCLNDHVTLNQLGRAGLFFFLRIAKNKMYHKKHIEPELNDQLDFDQFVQYRYVTKTQLKLVNESYERLTHSEDIFGLKIQRLKNHERFMMTPNYMIETTISDSDMDYIVALKQVFTDQVYMRQFLDKILIDKDVQPSSEFDINENEQSSQEVQFMSVQGITKYVQIFFSYIYGKNKVRHSPFSATQSFFMSDFYFRLFKKIFQVCGIKAFHATKDIIDEYIREPENREKQRLVSCYLTALQRSLLNVGNYIKDSMNVLLPNITQEIFYDYHLAFYYMCRDQDWQWLADPYRSFLNFCKEMVNQSQSSLKSLRYIQLLKILIQSQGPRALVLQTECFQEFASIMPVSKDSQWPTSTHIEEYVCTLATLLLQSVLVPIPIEQKHDQLVKISDNFQMWYNNDILNFFNLLSGFLKGNNTKNHQELAGRILEYLLIPRIDTVCWKFIAVPLQIIFENNNTEVDSQEILRRYVESEYDDPSGLLQIAENTVKHENWMIRRRANWFLRDWYFRTRFEGQIKEIPASLQTFEDRHPELQMQALTSVADYIRLYDLTQLQELFQNTKTNRIYILMAMLLSRMDRNFTWTNQALSEVLTLKNRTLLQKFVSEFWKNREDENFIFEIKISDQNIQALKEIVNPYVYFA